jgi:hypothetical protein
MYYYIFDPPQGAKEYERTAQIKEYLSTLGIAGELVTPQPGRTVEDLVNLAITKRYSTVVAVGGIALINRIAHALQPHDVVMGIIPLVDHPDIERIIGVKDWKVAAEQLKKRRWQTVRLGIFNKQHSFLVPATLELTATQAFGIQTKEYIMYGNGPATLTITPEDNEVGEPYLQVTCTPPTVQKGFLQRLFKNEEPELRITSVRLHNFELSASEDLPVTVAGSTIVTTPAQCGLQSHALKLIVARRTSSPTNP